MCVRDDVEKHNRENFQHFIEEIRYNGKESFFLHRHI